MKKLKLNLQSLNAEVLTRSQLKQILGGDDGSGGGGCKAKCLNSDQCTDSKCPSCMATGGLNNGACGSIT